MNEPVSSNPQPQAFAIAERHDRLQVASRVVRRHFWRRLLPSVALTTYMAVGWGTGWGTTALLVALGFGAFTAREAMRFRANLGRLRRAEDDLAALRKDRPTSKTAPERPVEGPHGEG